MNVWMRVHNILRTFRLTKGRFILHNFCLKLSHATCLQLELYCVNQAYNSSTATKASCVFDLHSTTQVVSRLHATVLGKYQSSKTVRIEVGKKMLT
jgi:hypothetical protein